MIAILTYDVANELIQNEQLIRNQEGPYRPKYDPVKKTFIPVIKCFPFEDLKEGFIQQRTVIKGMEDEVDDVCIAKINNNHITYKVNERYWCPSLYSNNQGIEMKKYSIMIYTPKFNNDTIFLTSDSICDLFEQAQKYKIFLNKDVKNMKLEEGIGDFLDKEFTKYQGICTYILFEGENICRCGKKY